MTTRRDTHLCELTMLLYDRHISGGSISLSTGHPWAVVGIGRGDGEGEYTSSVELPAIDMNSIFTVGIEVFSPAEVLGQRLTLQIAVQTVEKTWLIDQKFAFPELEPEVVTALPSPPPRTNMRTAQATEPRQWLMLSAVERETERWRAMARSTWPGMSDVFKRLPPTTTPAGPAPYTPIRPPTEYRPRHRKPGPARGPGH